MKVTGRWTLTAVVLAASVALGASATAQTIHHYGDSGSSSSSGGQGSAGSQAGGTWYPGMPAPKQPSGSSQPAQPKPSADATGKDDEKLKQSNRIRLYSGRSAASASPRTSLDLAVENLYRGIIPGTRDKVAHLSHARKMGEKAGHANELTWLGFRPTDDHTRVFFQTARKADYRIRRQQDPAVIAVTIKNTDIPSSNFSRFIDTSYFGRNVQRVEASKTDATTVELTIELTSFEQPVVRQKGAYVYLDFPYSAPESDDSARSKVAGKPAQ